MTLDEALNLAVEKLHVSQDQIYINLVNEGEESNTYEALLDVSLALEGKKYIENILKNFGVSYNIEARTVNNEKELYFIVDSSENPLLIGAKGRTIDALQVLLKNLLGTYTNEKMVITLDIGRYKENRENYSFLV